MVHQQQQTQPSNGTQTKEASDLDRLLAKPSRAIDPLAFEPSDFGEAEELAKKLFESGLVLGNAKNHKQVLGLIFFGRDLGLSVGQALRGIEIVEGHPSIRAQMAVALVKRSPACEWWRVVESTAERAVVQTKRRGSPEPETFSYSLQDAKNAGLLGKANWKHPIPMLLNRVGSVAAKAVYQDVIAGLAITEELQDEPPSPETDPIGAANTLPPVPTLGVSRAEEARSLIPAPAEQTATGAEAAPTPDPEKLTKEYRDQHLAEIEGLRAALVDFVGRERAKALIDAANAGFGGGLRTRTEFDERLNNLRRVVRENEPPVSEEPPPPVDAADEMPPDEPSKS